ncbi:hypothetical protein ElyMa_000099300 [Elysia marginata]|uniref:Uncharacterized protein n=1 Tax=Elysia marginata TaxID=1093978 RepID=A0AAV4EKF4_9GAST|nr:hypothetical protein ElyMa_000099300 [Elysia marginata]
MGKERRAKIRKKRGRGRWLCLPLLKGVKGWQYGATEQVEERKVFGWYSGRILALFWGRLIMMQKKVSCREGGVIITERRAGKSDITMWGE